MKSFIEINSIEFVGESVKELRKNGWNDKQIYKFLTEKRYREVTIK